MPDANGRLHWASSRGTTQAARAAGLVAARDMMELSGHNRWSAGTLASDGLGGFAGEEPRRAAWPFVVVAVLLLLALLGQVFHYFRTDIALRMPAAAAVYDLLGVAVPLLRNPALVSIETSDLQSDNARGLFVLQATLKNRAVHPQAWPALELSLTDTNDAVVARRVYAAEYLPPGTTSDAFPPNAEIPVKLWIEARGHRRFRLSPLHLLSLNHHDDTHLRLAGLRQHHGLPDRFKNHILPEQIHILNVAFLVPEMRRELVAVPATSPTT